jgi:hypothetical protein
MSKGLYQMAPIHLVNTETPFRNLPYSQTYFETKSHVDKTKIRMEVKESIADFIATGNTYDTNNYLKKWQSCCFR